MPNICFAVCVCPPFPDDLGLYLERDFLRGGAGAGLDDGLVREGERVALVKALAEDVNGSAFVRTLVVEPSGVRDAYRPVR
jgi:hypothetical protein